MRATFGDLHIGRMGCVGDDSGGSVVVEIKRIADYYLRTAVFQPPGYLREVTCPRP